jgi:DNA-binding response OmpR family regulator
MASAKRILMIDDDRPLQEALAEQLQLSGEFQVVMAGTGFEGLERAKTGPFDLVLLDVGLPDQDGREVCAALRKSGVRAPIIMLTGADTEADTIKGLEAGANDYVAKPFKFGVLLARIRAQLRQFEESENATCTVGPYAFKPGARLLIDNEDPSRKIHLTDKETAILKFLYRARTEAVPREQLLAEVWGYNAAVTTHTLETHIYRLRQKIEREPSKAALLITEAGGYRLIS